VTKTSVGYAGGTLANPTYKDVCGGTTGHSEVVEVVYDANAVSLERLFAIFWSLHDATASRAPQYRSVIFCRTAEQLRAATSSADRFEYGARLRKPLVTQIVRAATYYRAEEYHQRYFEKMRIKRAAH
jgi:peptide-methionine (S)-S-oxide reductase